MEITNRIKNALAAIGGKTNNGGPSGGVDPNNYLRYGNRKMTSTWSAPQISDQDFYTGYGYAVINKRANRSVVLGKKFLFTDANDPIVEKANKENKPVNHPYLSLIRNSEDFAERDFWYDISTYLDLEGVYFLMAVRTVTGNTVGNIQKFTLLNPYWVRQVINEKGELGGYVENNPHLGTREIRKELIIPIKLLNPFDPTKAYSLADAARDSQFTLKQANDFAREAIDGNLNAPGILSSAIELPDDQFDNFVNRVKNHGRGEPLFGNGSGTVSWVDMQTDLDKAALDKINSINRDTLLAISGLSKTGVGVEESGTGREVSRTQKDDFTENAIMPQIENIIDALNLDYRKYYKSQYSANGYSITLDNPLETNRDAEQADVDIRDSQFALMQSLIAKGYASDIAAKFAKGLIDLTALGEPTIDVTPVTPVEDPVTPEEPPVEPDTPTNSYSGKDFDAYEGYPIPVLQYLAENAHQVTPLSEKGSMIYSSSPVEKTVRIKRLIARKNSLLAVVDDSTFIKLAEFKQDADRPAILSELEKRYKGQLVAVKKKIDLTPHEHDLNEIIRNAVFDQQDQIDANTNDLLTSAQASEQQMYDWYQRAMGENFIKPNATELDNFIASLTLPFAVYFTVMFPIYASNRVQQTAQQTGIRDELPIIAMTTEIKAQINEFAKKEATSHVNTIKQDIENALAIIRATTDDPQARYQLFEEAFNKIQKRRALTLANSAAARIYNFSQYEADLQFLTRAGKVKQAYKVLFSLTGDPCPVCSHIIRETNSTPIPFTQAFATMGQTIEGMTFNYEQIIAGNVHPNCNCAYKLIILDKDDE